MGYHREISPYTCCNHDTEKSGATVYLGGGSLILGPKVSKKLLTDTMTILLAVRGNIATRSMSGPSFALQLHRTTVWCGATGAVVSIDLSDYYIVRDVHKILGILCHGVGLPVLSTIEP